MIKELQVCDPEIKALQYHAYPLSVIGSHKHFNPWFYSQYIQLYCNDNSSDDFFLDFFTYTYYAASNVLMDVYKVPREFMSNKNLTIIDFIEESLKSDYYITFHLDEYYLTDRSAYGEVHNCHDILISGFNNKNKMFMASGYDRNMNYVHNYVSYQEIELGFNNVQFIDWQDDSKFRDVFLLKIKNEEKLVFDDVLNLNLLKIYLNDYLHGHNSSERGLLFDKPIKGYKFGINTFTEFKKVLLALEESTTDIFPIIKAIHLIFEHKKIMKNRIKYLEDLLIMPPEFNLSKQYEEVEKKSLLIKNLILKYHLKKQKEILISIVDLLDQLSTEEVVILSTLLYHSFRRIIKLL